MVTVGLIPPQRPILSDLPLSHQTRGGQRAPETCALKLTVLPSPSAGPQAVLRHQNSTKLGGNAVNRPRAARRLRDHTCPHGGIASGAGGSQPQ